MGQRDDPGEVHHWRISDLLSHIECPRVRASSLSYRQLAIAVEERKRACDRLVQPPRSMRSLLPIARSLFS
ncbi:MAG: hypothetical protein QNJ38_14580 [Prochloraceae cyanobacterium]|nr:hypothetical protein [Prochloraceae cyanobacterium]